ncbi:unnamed protein product, partial [Brassica oleracea var. botrytis]
SGSASGPVLKTLGTIHFHPYHDSFAISGNAYSLRLYNFWVQYIWYTEGMML